jgi:ribosomal protein S18 acetylase RimI-like enzyme
VVPEAGSRVRIEGIRDGDLTEILRDFGRFWGDGGDLVRHLHHPMFFMEFRDTAYIARDLDNDTIAGYLLGFVAPTGDGYIHFIAVRDDSRTLGLGSALYGTFEMAARERGAVALKAITNPENEASVAFHRRLGFTEMVRFDDYGGSGRPRVVMRKPLSQGAG